jgi:HAE1 family hydrophobic/amphiphilic exporter-1
MAAAVASNFLSPWYVIGSLGLLLGASAWYARGALVTSLAIPTSLVGSFLVLHALGRSLNVVSLAGLAFAVGMLVDNAVVVLENIYQWRARGFSVMQAAVRGTQEVWGAVAASTLTTVAVFIPVVFVQQEAGQLFRDIALAISSSVALSLVVSVTLIPTAAARLLQQAPAEDLASRSVWTRGIARVSTAFTDGVVGLNAWVQQGFLRKAAVALVMTAASIGLSWQFWPQVEYLPTGNRNLVFGILLPPPGYNIDQLMSLGETVEKGLRPYWDVDPGSVDAQRLDAPPVADFFFVARGRSVFIGVRAFDPLRAGELVPLVQRVSGGIPGAFAIAKQTSLFEDGLTAGRTIDIEITGPEIERLVALGGQTFGMARQLMPQAQIRPVPSLDLSSPEVHITPKLLQSADMQVNAAELGFAVNALVDGAYVGDYLLGGKKIDLTVIGETKYAERTHELGAVPVATPLGQLVPLTALADVRLTSGPEQINHRERERAITIEVSPPAEIALEDALAAIQQGVVGPLLQSGSLEGGYRVRLAGTADKLRSTWEALRWNVGLALLITYLLMAALFESWLYPLVIILTVPLGAVGGILGLRLLNCFLLQPLDVLTMLGFVILIGTVVNNPILIVHQSINHMQIDGMAHREAILESVRSRIRPIFMTTTTTVLGLLPLVLFPGAGSELYRGLGSVVLGGLAVSTLFTLILVPTLFALTLEAKQAVLRLFAGRPAAPPALDEQPQPVEELELA